MIFSTILWVSGSVDVFASSVSGTPVNTTLYYDSYNLGAGETRSVTYPLESSSSYGHYGTGSGAGDFIQRYESFGEFIPSFRILNVGPVEGFYYLGNSKYRLIIDVPYKYVSSASSDLYGYFVSPSVMDLEVLSQAGSNLGFSYDWRVATNTSSNIYRITIEIRVFSDMPYYGSQILIKPRIALSYYSYNLPCRSVTATYSGSILDQNFELVEDTNDIVDITNDIKDSTDNIQDSAESIKDSAEKSVETGNNILTKITDFFGGFFDNLINSIVSVFVPDEDFFSTWFDDLNAFFTDHLGFLWQPIDWTVSVVSAFLGSGGSTTLTFPGFSIMGYQIWNDVQVDLAQIWGEIPVQDYIYMATDLIIIGSVVALVYKKYEEVMSG